MFEQKIQIDTYDELEPKCCQTYLYAIDLFNFGFYWESHVYLEELWNQAKRVGENADFFKMLIKLGAAGV